MLDKHHWLLVTLLVVNAAAMETLPILLDELVPLRGLAADAVTAALALDHPVYDGFYLALAVQREARLVTADRRLLGKVGGTRWAGFVTGLADFE